MWKMWKICYGFQTHNLSKMSRLPQPLDQDSQKIAKNWN